MDNNTDIKFMRRALQLSLKGHGHVNPNPLVGAVIVKNNEIIGEGYHEKFGEAHAEINAINNAKEKVAGSTMYVTMEPCNHRGKTPPCTERIIMEKINRVVIGMRDPNKNVKGNGILNLMKAGISITSGILEKEILKSNEVFSKFIQTNIPFCAMKTAMTLDGKIATYTGDSKWISNEKSRKLVHELRHRYTGIMVGVNTVIKDNPLLTNRSDNPDKRNPVRIIVDSAGKIPMDANVLDTKQANTIIAVTERASSSFIQKINSRGIRVITCPENQGRVNLKFLLSELGKSGIDSILLEGGSRLNFSAIREGIVDKVYSFISPKMVGGENANTPVGGTGVERIDDAILLNIDEIKRFDEDILIKAYIAKV